MTVLLVAGGMVSSLLMLAVGGLLGPPDPVAVLEGAAVGETAPMALGLRATGLVWLWSAASAFGVVSWVLVIAKPESVEVEEMVAEADPEADPDALRESGPSSAAGRRSGVQDGPDDDPRLSALGPDSPRVG